MLTPGLVLLPVTSPAKIGDYSTVVQRLLPTLLHRGHGTTNGAFKNRKKKSSVAGGSNCPGAKLMRGQK